MNVKDIIHEVRMQAYYLKAKDPSLRPLRVYLGREEIDLLKSEVEFLYDNMERQEDELRLMGMPVFEVVTDKPHIKVTTN